SRLVQTAPLEAVQRGVERALLHVKHIAGQLLNALRNGPAVLRFERQRLQNQEIQRALRQVDTGHRDSMPESPVEVQGEEAPAGVQRRLRRPVPLRSHSRGVMAGTPSFPTKCFAFQLMNALNAPACCSTMSAISASFSAMRLSILVSSSR